MKQRAPNLTPSRIDTIINLIRAWQGRLTWPALIKAIATECSITYTRQALFKHDRIRVAYEVYHNAPEVGASRKTARPMSATLQAAVDRVHRLEQENAELRKREALLLEQFHRWAYNASARGLTLEFLDQPLPPLNRNGNRPDPLRAVK